MANLVENEVNPTSMHSMPINDDMLPNMDSDTLGNLTPFNNVKGSFDNLKGSYNNLFCDNLDDEPGQTLSLEHTDPANVQQMTSQLLENVYCNVSPTMVRQKLPATASTVMAKESPQFNAHTISTNRIVDNLLTASDPNLHVYSNIGNATINETNPMMSTTNSKTKVNDVLATMSNATLPLKSKSTPTTAAAAALAATTTTIAAATVKDSPTIESIISQSILNKSSKLLSDNLNDLDLDDPTLVSGSIVNTPIATANISTMSKVLKNNNSDSIGSIGGSGGGGGAALSHNKYSSSKKSRQSLNVDDSRSNIAKKLFNDTTTSTTSGMDAISENGNGSYLRSLHDTTMIDTALDLDSIEDTTIGIQNVG